MSLPRIEFNKIYNDAKSIIFTENDSYIETYPEFIKYFEMIDVGEINEHNLIIGSHFVYGWMPTIIRLDLTEKDKAIFLLNAVKSGHILKENELNILKNVINNSLVGLSKLLHFINPIDYAIWDSRIFKYITKKKSTYGINNPKLYLDYLSEIKRLSEHEYYYKLESLISRNFEYEIHPSRVLEVTMFETERNKSIKNNNKYMVEIDPDKLDSEETENHLKQIDNNGIND
jgi:hypothetical protein